MKTTWSILLALTIISCGPVPEEPGLENRLGQNIEVDENDTFGSSEVKNAAKICSSLSDKEFAFRSALRTNTVVEMNFDLKQKNCGDEEYGNTESAVAVVEDNGGFLRFKSDNSNLASDILVSDSKIVNDICGKDISTSTQRYVLSGNYGVWYQFLPNNLGVCGKMLEGEVDQALGDSFCLVMTTAKKNDQGQFVIQDAELYEVLNTNDKNNGVVVKRNFASNRDCSEGDQFFSKNQYNKL